MRHAGESLTGRIENVEVRYAGQLGRLGRYPIHFHMIGAVRNSYVRGCSIHHTHNRWLKPASTLGEDSVAWPLLAGPDAQAAPARS